MEMTVQTCPVCAMRIEEGRGVVRPGGVFCCEGCANGTGCTCPEEM